MMNTVTFADSRRTLAEDMETLGKTARGDEAATLVIENARLVNVMSGEIQPGMSIAVQGERIAYVGYNASHTKGPHTRVINAGGRYVTPGLIDGHCHIESSQITPRQFARAVLPKGTTGGFFDAHEIANVLGMKGLRLMLEELRQTPMAGYMQAASCVPSTSSDVETSGAELGPDEVAEAFTWGPDMVALGEVMNFPGVVFGDEKMLGEIKETLKAGRVADGHYTWPSGDWRMSAYAASGISGDHEVTSAEEVIDRVRLGMYAKLRRGSAWHDVVPTITAYTEQGIDTRRLMLVTDDRSPESLVDEGHMDFVVRHAIEQGVPPVTAFQMATLNTAERFGLSQDIGSVTPGRYADILILDGPLRDVNVRTTIAAGVEAAEDGDMLIDWESSGIPDEAMQSVHLQSDVKAEDFHVEGPAGEPDGAYTARAIQVRENHVDTKEEHIEVPVRDGRLRLPENKDVCWISVIERHGLKGSQASAYLTNVGFTKPAALASTTAHDSHNLLVIGNNETLMAEAANKVIDMQGGVVVVTENDTTALPLPVAGLMSPEPFEHVAEQSKGISRALESAGCTMNYAFMTLSLLALVVIPDLRLSDIGLIQHTDEGFRQVPLLVDEN
ncbi:adenine deaminase [Salibacterium qingdaonense]|uniref:Adenine deaminase n=1 Tax=Salibacterium qingdaonense TaxID=266892 RepID=A0A1I4HUT2_9BACI|nr:adenine deaminase C-terminal domain-containing protein [Salibacterium qingdaonense]SFL45902.1 Adenine deaminase [Salibacterium qingdaonense]